jgi:methionine aminopeptidase
VIQKVAASYGVNTIEGVLSHEMKQYIIDGENVIIQTPTKTQNVSEFTFEENQVFSLDVIMSTGSGKVWLLSFI